MAERVVVPAPAAALAMVEAARATHPDLRSTVPLQATVVPALHRAMAAKEAGELLRAATVPLPVTDLLQEDTERAVEAGTENRCC